MNCVANGKILDQSGFEKMFGCNLLPEMLVRQLVVHLSYIYKYKKKVRLINKNDSMKSSYLGPEFTNDIIQKYLDKLNIKYQKLR